MRRGLAIFIVFVIFIIAIIAARIFTGVGPAQVDSGCRIVMGTIARIVVVAENEKIAKQAIIAAFQRQQEIEQLMSYHLDDSLLSDINRNAFIEPVEIDTEMFSILQKAKEFSQLSDGAFDITVGALIDLWNNAAEVNEIPGDIELQKARAAIGWEKLILDANDSTVSFKAEGMKIDLGGIAKGYAIDESVKVLKQKGIWGAMVDIGGDVCCFGETPAGQDFWIVGIQNPNVQANEFSLENVILILKIQDKAIATSGGYRRYNTIQGQKQSHIIDPQTGSGSEKLKSVTIIAPDAITADALATAVSVLGQDKGIALIEKLADIEAIIINQTGEIIKTKNAELYIK